MGEEVYTPQMCPSCCFPHLLRVSVHRRLLRSLFLGRSVVRHSSLARVVFNLQRKLCFYSYLIFIFSLTRLGSPSLAQDRSSRPWQRSRGHPPHGTNNRPRRTAQGMTRRTQFIYCKPREFIFTYKLAHGAISPTRLLYMKSH